MISIYRKNKNKKYTYPDYANSKVSLQAQL